MAGGGGYLDMNGAPGTAAESEAEDARREAEEADCVFSAEDLERCVSAGEAGEACVQEMPRMHLNAESQILLGP